MYGINAHGFGRRVAEVGGLWADSSQFCWLKVIGHGKRVMSSVAAVYPLHREIVQKLADFLAFLSSKAQKWPS
jgi:hypothetical protein